MLVTWAIKIFGRKDRHGTLTGGTGWREGGRRKHTDTHTHTHTHTQTEREREREREREIGSRSNQGLAAANE